jgi:hypothetical protein
MFRKSLQHLILRQKRQRQQRSQSPVEVEEIMSPEVDPQGGAVTLSTAVPSVTIPDRDNAPQRPQSTNSPAMPQSEELAGNPTMPHPDASIKVSADVLAESEISLAVSDAVDSDISTENADVMLA